VKVCAKPPPFLVTDTREEVVSCAAKGLACRHLTWNVVPTLPPMPAIVARLLSASTSIGALGTNVLKRTCAAGPHPADALREIGPHARATTR